MKTHVEEKFDVSYDLHYLPTFLRERGMTLRKPRPFHHKRRNEDLVRYAWKLILISFLYWYLTRQGLHVMIAFEDESHFQVEPNVKRGWFPEGVAPTCAVNYEYGRATVFGTLTEDGEFIARVLENGDSENFKTYLDVLRRRMEEEGVDTLFLFMDNASYHTSNSVKEHLENVNGGDDTIIIPVFLPPYSPDLNPVENSWKNWKYETALKLFKGFNELEEFLKDLAERKRDFNHYKFEAFLDPSLPTVETD